MNIYVIVGRKEGFFVFERFSQHGAKGRIHK